MGTRTRTVEVLAVSQAERREATKALATALTLLEKAVHQIGASTHPLEAARIQTEFLHALTLQSGTVAEMRRSAVLTVYARGRAEYSRFGFGSIATALDMSKPRVQQIVGAFKDGKKSDDAGDRTRLEADRIRTGAKSAPLPVPGPAHQ